MMRSGKSVVIARSLAVLLAGVFFGSSVCYGWGSGHWKITQAALDSLPEWQIARWRESEAGFQKYCVYVDMGLDNAEAKSYLVVVNKRLFHYFPRDNREDYQVFMEGAERYVQLIVDKLREGAPIVAVRVRAVTSAELFATVKAGKVFPPKSTYFYPKLWSGMVMRLFEFDR